MILIAINLKRIYLYELFIRIFIGTETMGVFHRVLDDIMVLLVVAVVADSLDFGIDSEYN